MHVVVINDGNLPLLPDALICQVKNICVVCMETVQHQCECRVHILDITLRNLFHFDSFIVLKVQNQAGKLQQVTDREQIALKQH